MPNIMIIVRSASIVIIIIYICANGLETKMSTQMFCKMFQKIAIVV